MKKISLVAALKWLAYAWTVASLLFLAYAAVSLKLQTIKSDREYELEEAKGFEKISGDFTVRVAHEGKDYLDGHHLSVLRDGKPVVEKFGLPVKESGVYEFTPKDVIVMPDRAGGLKVVLLSALHDCDVESRSDIWFLKFSNKGELIKRISLSGARILSRNPFRLMGSRVVPLPYLTEFGGYSPEPFVIQTEVSAGEDIRIAPMLSRDALAAISRAFRSELGRGIAAVKASSDTGMAEMFLQAGKDFDQAVSTTVLEY